MTRIAFTLVLFAALFAVAPAVAEPLRPIDVAQAEKPRNASTTYEIAIRKRKVAGEQVIRVTQGDVIRLKWTSDEPVELHLHGYDIEAEVAPGKPGFMWFAARATGRFPVEAHGFGGEHGHGQGHGEGALLYLEVLPK